MKWNISGFRRFFLAVSGLLVAQSANAATYNIDINSVPTVPGTGGYYPAAIVGSGGILFYGYQTPIYLLNSLGLPLGSTVNLGTLVVNPLYTFDQYGDRGVYLPDYSLYGQQVSELYQVPNYLCHLS